MSRTSVNTRRAAVDDFDDVVALCLEARDESPLVAHVSSADPAVLHRQLGAGIDQPDTVFLVAGRDDAVVGFSLARIVRPGPLFSVGWLEVEVIYVKRAARRLGVGHELMSALAHVARDEQCEYVVAMPFTAVRSEQRLLARLGFTSAGARRIATTESLVKRVEQRAVPRERRRDRARESLLAARRRRRDAGTGHVELLPLAAGAESSSRQVSRPVETRRPSSSETTSS